MIKLKFKVAKAALVAAVSKAERAVPARSTIPALEFMLLGANGAEAYVSATSLDLSVHAPVEGALVTTPGQGAVSAKMFRDIVAKLPDGEVTVAVDEKFQATVTCGRVKVVVPGIDPEQYPELPAVDGETFDMTVEELRAAVQGTAFAASRSGDPRTSAVHIETGPKFAPGMRVTALDGHRIAIRLAEVPDFQPIPELDMLVPVNVLTDAVRALPKDGNVTVSVDKSHLRFTAEDGTEATAVRVDGKYFDVDRMVAMDVKTSVTISRDAVLAALDRASLFVRENDKVPIVMETGDGCITISILSVLGRGEEPVDADVAGEPLKIGFNPRLLMEALRASDDTEIKIDFSTARQPCAIKGARYHHIILPVAIRG